MGAKQGPNSGFSEQVRPENRRSTAGALRRCQIRNLRRGSIGDMAASFAVGFATAGCSSLAAPGSSWEMSLEAMDLPPLTIGDSTFECDSGSLARFGLGSTLKSTGRLWSPKHRSCQSLPPARGLSAGSRLNSSKYQYLGPPALPSRLFLSRLTVHRGLRDSGGPETICRAWKAAVRG